MSITRGNLRVLIANHADAGNVSVGLSTRWDFSAGGEVDQLAGHEHLRLWKRVLNAVPEFNTATVTVTTTGANPASIWPQGGTFDLSQLSSGTGDTQKNFYRILELSFNNLPYKFERAKNFLLASVNGITYQTWIRMGSTIVVPDAVSTTGTAWVNWTPTPVHQLATDSSVVYLPAPQMDAAVAGDDANMILAQITAARMLRKGGAESGAADDLKAEAMESLEELLQDLSRVSASPLTMDFDDSRFDWGNQ